MQRVISRKRRHTQKLLEESINPASSGYDSNSIPSTSATSDRNCSISNLLQTAERLQFLFTPSGGEICNFCHENSDIEIGTNERTFTVAIYFIYCLGLI